MKMEVIILAQKGNDRGVGPEGIEILSSRCRRRYLTCNRHWSRLQRHGLLHDCPLVTQSTSLSLSELPYQGLLRGHPPGA